MTSNELSNIKHAIELIANQKQAIMDEWVDTIREQFTGTETSTDAELEDHFSLIIQHLTDELQVYLEEQKNYKITQRFSHTNNITTPSEESAKIYGKQRAGINAYNVVKVYREYIFLRNILVEKLKANGLLSILTLQIVTTVIDNNTQQSIRSFSSSIQDVQRRLLGSLVHDIRGPLSVVSLNCEMNALDPNRENIEKRHPQAMRALDRVSVMLEDMLQTISIEGGQGLDLCFAKVNILDHLEKLTRDTNTTYSASCKFISHVDKLEVICDPDAIVRCLENLISNACKYGDQQQPISLTVSTSEKRAIFAVHNFGSFITDEEQAGIFRFLNSYSGREKKRSKSWGIGLSIVQAVVDGHRGKIFIDSSTKHGTTFTMSIPLSEFSEGTNINVKL